MKQKIWKPLRENTAHEVESMMQQLGVNRVFAQLLLNRSIFTIQEAETFFNPKFEHLHDPMLMNDMGKAVERITKARDQNEFVWIYGDYDVDGTTSVALVFSFLRQFLTPIDYYVPDREKEGYGISALAIELAAKAGVTLIIALDCGTRSVELVQVAKEKGIDFIICDHHEPGEKLPDAIALLNPKRADNTYPFSELSGCGIGFKLVQALCITWELPMEEAYSYLDFVAVSIASDLVPMVDENRTLAYLGMKKLNVNPSPGLQMVISKFIKAQDLDITSVVFTIGPRINAAGRMADARFAIRLLLAEDEEECDRLAVELNGFNETRKGLDLIITTEALQQIEQDENFHKRKTTVVYHPGWHKGVVGIVASRLIEAHYKPTIVLTQSGNDLVGSARSIEAFNVHDALIECSNHLIQFGGHKYAAGLKLKLENLESFKEAFEQSANKLSEDDLTEVLKYDAEISLKSITQKFYESLKRCAPFGPGNLKPVFLSRNVRDTKFAKTLGQNQSHLKLNVISDDCSEAIGAIGFGLGKYYRAVSKGAKFDMLYTIEENHYNDVSTLQLMVYDIRI